MNKETIEDRLGRLSDISKKYTASAILAGAHLCGPYAVIDYFEKGNNSKDEYGTRIKQYMNEFNHYGDGTVRKKKLKAVCEDYR